MQLKYHRLCIRICKGVSIKVLEETMFDRINRNNIPLRQNRQEQHLNKRYILYVEQIVYLLMVGEPNNKQQNQQVNLYNKNKTNLLKELYKRLTAYGQNSFDSVHFYLKMRKASKILYRNPVISTQNGLSCFKVFKNTDQYKQDKNGSLVIVVNHNQLMKDILTDQINKQHLPLKFYICGEMDGIAVKMGQPFRLESFQSLVLQSREK